MSFFFCEELLCQLLFFFNFLFPLSVLFNERREIFAPFFFAHEERKRTRIINNVIRLRESSELLLF